MRKFTHVITKKIDQSENRDFWFEMSDYKRGVILSQVRVTMKDGSKVEIDKQRIEASQSEWLMRSKKYFSVTVPDGDNVENIEMRCKYDVFGGWTAYFSIEKTSKFEDVSSVDEAAFSKIVSEQAEKLKKSAQ